MKIAYLIDRDVIGGGMEYVRRQIAAHPDDECRVFFADCGECAAANVNAWGADEIVVNHLRALLQLMRNPLRRPLGRMTFVVHGIHWRRYDWMIRECGTWSPRAVPLRLARFARRMLESWLYRKCDRIVVLTETDRADALRLYGRRLKVGLEPNTLDGWVPRISNGLPDGVEGAFKYVCIGRFAYPKGQDRWIRRIQNEELRVKNDGGRTLFIGDGPMLAECRRLAQGLGIADRCVFAGAIPDADRYLKSADIVVSPSRWEGMPYLMMKARALGCRILATDCPGNRDVLAGYEKWELLDV